MANELQENGIHTTLIPDSSVGYFMSRVNLVIMGAEAVVETGGILNKLGSLQIGVLAKTFNVPVYIATGKKHSRMITQKHTNSLGCIHLVRRVFLSIKPIRQLLPRVDQRI